MNITTHTNSQNVTIVTMKARGTYLGRSEFFSGLHAGEQVEVNITTYVHPDGHTNTTRAVRGQGAWLSLHDPKDVEVNA